MTALLRENERAFIIYQSGACRVRGEGSESGDGEKDFGLRYRTLLLLRFWHGMEGPMDLHSTAQNHTSATSMASNELPSSFQGSLEEYVQQ
jgi:hypothetical protein